MKTFTGVIDHQAIWDRTPTNLDPNNDHKLDNDINGFDDADPNTNPKDGGKIIPLGDNMSCIANYPIIEQGVDIKNKKLVLIISFYILNYFQSEQTNLFQVLNSLFLFTNHVPKRVVESLH